MGTPERQNVRQRRPRRWCFPLSVVVWLLALVACSGDADHVVINVYAASSLTDIMQQVEEQYEQQHQGVDIRVNVAGTNTLIRQLNDGAEADVFVAADVSAFRQLIDKPIVGPHPLAVNTLTMVVPQSNPAGIVDPADLADSAVLTARCATGVPCGDATDRFLDATGLTIGRSTDESNVRSVLAKVSADEVDVGFVYRSDLGAAADVTEIALAEPPQVTVGVAQLVSDAPAAGFTEHLRSDDVAVLFMDMGFDPTNRAPDQ